ncbi:unnamed protein product [Leptidea sinapis]|uniref:Uncharacterized protein n=1 Tax=Leptidea sinapis TaxID=189913 RepID=A0A5E4QAX2_9NEOP|nr:unnamed protein product [Leptidea sinapis]
MPVTMKPIKMDEIDSALRRRYPVVKQQQKEATQEKEEKSEFVARESPLTVLIENSLHIRAIYHIFVAIVVVLLCDTVIYDLNQCRTWIGRAWIWRCKARPENMAASTVAGSRSIPRDMDIRCWKENNQQQTRFM